MKGAQSVGSPELRITDTDEGHMKRMAWIASVAVFLLVAGCGSSDSRATEGTVTVDISVKDGDVTPAGDRVDVRVGQTVTLRISADVEETIHVHTEPEHEYVVGPGDTIQKSFTVYTPGLVAIEAHRLDTTIVRLVVSP
jgi:plastocyanin